MLTFFNWWSFHDILNICNEFYSFMVNVFILNCIKTYLMSKCFLSELLICWLFFFLICLSQWIPWYEVKPCLEYISVFLKKIDMRIKSIQKRFHLPNIGGYLCSVNGKRIRSFLLGNNFFLNIFTQNMGIFFVHKWKDKLLSSWAY